DHINDLDYDVDDKKAKKAFKALQSDMEKFVKLLDQKLAQYQNATVTMNLAGHGFDQIPEWLTFAQSYGVTKDMYSQLDDVIDYIKENADELDGLVDDLKDIRSLTDDLDSYINSVVNDYKCDIRRTDDDITGYTDLIADQMDILAEGLKGSDKVIRDQLNKMVDQMHNVNDSLDDGFDEIDEEFAKLRDTENLNDVFDDISNSEDSVPSLGNIMRCENNGGITSDINGGGIAGYIDIDTGSQSDFEVVSGGNISLNYDRTQKATVLKCVNKGPVTVKNSYAGGIVGRADVGAVIKCENYAEVMTDEGDYSGGIVGKSAFVVRDNYSMSVVEGNDYVGGIAGYGRDLSGNHAMATIDMSEGEKRGAIAGDVDEDGVVGGNIVVGDLPAINGVTYTGQAENVEYKAFIGDTSTPKEFKTMTVTFMSHGGVVATKQVPYGGSIPYDEFPELGQSDEFFEVWENEDLNDIKQNIVVNSEEVTWTTTIASKEAFPQVLMIGNFYTGTTLEYERGKIPLRNVIEDYESLDNYTFNIESEYGLTSTEFECRILADDYDDIAEVALEKDGKVSIVNSRRDGRYMVFPYEEGDIVWIVRSNQKEIVKQISFWALVGGGAVLVILILIFIISRIIKRRKRKKAQMADNKE
ncbi:MAG: hypothetical protein K6F99_06585, partial [Lachnospiraceae bacterium]|nr:hypothetical protein [Lachnospiraceae bacterium]